MRLRTRILLGYGYLIALVLLAAGSAVVGFFDLSGGIQEIRKHHVRSVRETTRLMEALERQDSATLRQLIESNGERDALRNAEEKFREAFESLETRAESKDDQSILKSIDRRYREYRAARTALLEEPPARPLSAYRDRVSPKFRSVKERVYALLNSNHEAINEADRDARNRALQYGSWVGFLVVVALFSFVFLTRKLRLNVLDRLSQIREVAEAVESGDRRRRVAVNQDDELGIVGRELNRALDRYQEIEARLDGRERELKQLVLGVLEQIDRPAALYGADGEAIANTLSSDRFEALPAEATSAIVERGRELFRDRDASSTEIELPELGVEAELRVVSTSAGRSAGWLALFDSLPSSDG